MIENKCDYCGGWTDGECIGNDEFSIQQTRVDVSLISPKFGTHKNVCIDCIIKALDLVLGEKKND